MDNNNLQNFSKHVPHILRQQLLLKLSNKFINDNNEEWNQESIRTPTIQRFRGALLFVDISGFTVLSQRLDIESLKNHINDYFTKMLTIVDKWGGDVIKFAGDALFIIWHSQILDTEENYQYNDTEALPSDRNPHSADALMSEAAERAVACALEICSSCGHYEVKLQNGGLDAHTHMFDRFMPQRRNSAINSGKIAPMDSAPTAPNSPVKSVEENVTYLDVHCGISMGLMAGIDIGHGDRWEFFLAGSPLNDVAAAEDKAKKGDVVVSSLLHRSVHGEQPQGAVDMEGNTILPCGCALLADDFCRVRKVDTKPPRKARKNRLKARKEGFQAIAYENSRIIEDTTHDMEMLFISMSPIFRKLYNAAMANQQNSPRNSLLLREGSNAVTPVRRVTKDRRNDQLATFINMELKRTYYASIAKVLTDDLGRHVHDAVRSDYDFNDVRECENFRDTTNALLARHNNQQAVLHNPDAVPSAVLVAEDDSPVRNALSASVSAGVLTSSTSSTPSHHHHHQQQYHQQHSQQTISVAGSTHSLNQHQSYNSHNEVSAAQLAVSSEILTSNAEVRSVTVMFIKIDTINLQIVTDEGEDRIVQEDVGNENSKVFGFLVRSKREIAADTAILNQIQGCFAILHSAIYGNGGQLRQFIVDDKGTVCIATFGLRGAVSVDNAASSIETAHQIIQALPSLNLSCSIGITTGKAYCGLVGSPLRHEYAVMGPSTNLSARLMCKAAANSVICDEDTMRRDRLHEYQPLAEIQAKGYANPVKIFRPAFQGILPETVKPSPAVNHANNSNTHLTLKVAARQIVRGRKDTRFSSMYTYLMRQMCLDWILSNRSKWELEIRDMINSPFFYENEFNKAHRKSISEASVSSNNPNASGHNSMNSNNSHASSTHSSFHGIPTPIRKLHGRKKEVKRVLTALLPPLQSAGNVMFGFGDPAQMVVISGGMGSGKTAVLSAIARKIQFMAERDRCLNIFIARKKSNTMKSKVPFSFWKPLVCSLITLFTKDTTATSLPASGRTGHGHGQNMHGSHNHVNLKKVIICLDKMLRIYSKDQISTRDLLIKILISDDDAIFNSSDVKSSDLANVAEALATLIDFMPNLANRFIIVFIEDLHFLDPWSLRVMFLIWQKATGISLLATYDSDQAPSDEGHSTDHVQLHRLVHQRSRMLVGASTNSSSNLLSGHSSKERDNYFRLFTDSKRFAIVELPPLDKDSTIKVAKEALSDVGIIATDSDLSKLFDISGGNPLYTIELTKALQTIHHQTNSARSENDGSGYLSAGSSHNSSHHGGSDAPNALLGNGNNGANRGTTNNGSSGGGDIKADLNELFNMNSRVEEVICYRFDKLTTSQQLVLKAASIAVSNGRNFTAEMIVYLLEESDQFTVASDLMPGRAHGGLAPHLHGNNNSSNVPPAGRRYEITNSENSPHHSPDHHHTGGAFAFGGRKGQIPHHHEAVDRILLHLVHHHDFIKLMPVHDQSDKHHAKQYNFTIPLEQTSIYQLVIDEQKQWFHERMAMFCRQSATSRQVDAIDDRLADLKEEAFHWEHATAWGNALKALMACATCERQRGNEISWLQHLQACYGLFKQIEQDTGTIIPMPEEKLPEPHVLAKILLQSSYSATASTTIAANCLLFPTVTTPFSQPAAPIASTNSTVLSNVDEEVVDYMRTLDREMLMMFESFSEIDPDVAPIIFYLHISLADAYILAWEDMKILLSTLGVALRFCLAAKYCDVFPGKTRASVQRQRMQNNLLGPSASRDEYDSNTHSGRYGGIGLGRSVSSLRLGSNANNRSLPQQNTKANSLYQFSLPTEYVQHLISTMSVAYYTSLQYVSHREREAFGASRLMQVPPLFFGQSVQYLLNSPRSNTVTTTNTTNAGGEQQKGLYHTESTYSITSSLACTSSHIGDDVQFLILQTLHLQYIGCYEEAYVLWRDSSPTLRFSDLDIAIESSKSRIQRFGMDAVIFVTGQFMQWLVLAGKDKSFRGEFVRMEVLNSFYHVPHVPSLEYLTLFAIPSCVFNDDYDTAIQCRAHYRQALQQYQEQVEVSSPALNQVLIMWARAGMVVYQYADSVVLYSSSITPSHSHINTINHQSSAIIQQQVEIFDLESARPEDLFQAIETAEMLNRAKMTGSNDVITLLTLQCMVARGVCLNSLVLQMLCALYLLTPSSSPNDLGPIDELFEKWFNRLVHTMVLATHLHTSPHPIHRQHSPAHESSSDADAAGQGTGLEPHLAPIMSCSEEAALDATVSVVVVTGAANNNRSFSQHSGRSTGLTNIPPPLQILDNSNDNDNNDTNEVKPTTVTRTSVSSIASGLSPIKITSPTTEGDLDLVSVSSSASPTAAAAASAEEEVYTGPALVSTTKERAATSYSSLEKFQLQREDSVVEAVTGVDSLGLEPSTNNANGGVFVGSGVVIGNIVTQSHQNSRSHMSSAPRLLGSGLGEAGSGAWNILNILNVLSVLVKVLDQRQEDSISLRIPLTMEVVHAFMRQHNGRLALLLQEQGLLGAHQCLLWLQQRMESLDESRRSALDRVRHPDRIHRNHGHSHIDTGAITTESTK